MLLHMAPVTFLALVFSIVFLIVGSVEHVSIRLPELSWGVGQQARHESKAVRAALPKTTQVMLAETGRTKSLSM